jgi:putative sigma-54 modulation protein
MNVEYTGRQCEVTPAIRKQVEHGLAKITRIFGENNFKTQVILTSEKYRQIAEITVMVRDKPIVGLAEGTEMLLVVGEALDHIERQAIKFKSRRRTKKRHPKKKKWQAPEQARKMQVSVGATATTAVPVVVHTYPALVRTTEAHVVPAQDAVAMRPLTLEEAIKECEFRDRDVFVFRDPQGRVKVLHRTKDGKMELIEAP